MDEQQKETVKRSKKAPILITVSLVIVTTVAVLGYGFFNGARIKNYAKAAEEMMTETEKWEESVDSKDPETVQEELKKIESYAKDQLGVLANPAPKKAQKLQKNLREYFTGVKRIVGDVIVLLEWSEKITKITTSATDFSNVDLNSPDSFQKSLETAKTDIDKAVVELEEMSPPASLTTDHQNLIKYMKEMSSFYEKMITATKTNNYTALTSMTSDLNTTISGLSSADSADFGESFEKEAAKMEDLEKEITTGITELKNTKFSF